MISHSNKHLWYKFCDLLVDVLCLCFNILASNVFVNELWEIGLNYEKCKILFSQNFSCCAYMFYVLYVYNMNVMLWCTKDCGCLYRVK